MSRPPEQLHPEASAILEEQPNTSRYQAIEVALGDCDIEIYEAENRLLGVELTIEDPRVKQSIHLLRARYEATYSDSESSNAPSFRDLLLEVQDSLPQDYVQAELAREEACQKSNRLYAELISCAPEKAADLLPKLIQLEASINYDKAASIVLHSTYDSRQVRRKIGLIIDTRTLIDRGEIPSYKQLCEIESLIEQYRLEWAENGLLYDEANQTQPLEHTLSTLELSQYLEEAIEKICNIYELGGIYGQNLTRYVLLANRISSLFPDDYEPVTKDNLLDMQGGALNPAFAAAIVKEIDHILAAMAPDTESDVYKSFVEKAKNMDVECALDMLCVDGNIEGLPFNFDEVELKTFLQEHIPPLALNAVKVTHFLPIDGYRIAGQHRFEGVDISDEMLWTLYGEATKEANNTEKTRADLLIDIKERALGFIVHEYAHALHQVLPPAALERWHKKRASDKTYVSPYVQYHVAHGTPHKYMEDFTESMRLFVMEPEELRRISPIRYEAMEELLADLMHTPPSGKSI